MTVALFNQKGAVGKADLRHPSGCTVADMPRDLLAHEFAQQGDPS
ncbi:ParA family protein [Pseudaminobacter soli (ex Li et al. 2025)]|nr:ParA family protein [Mesorhizobium soli]